MSIYRRIFTSVVACGLLLGSVFFIRLQLTNTEQRRKPAPEFLPNVARFRAPRVCSQTALVLVHSDPGRSHRRQVIRETWAHPTVTQSLDISVAFGVGPASGADAQRSLDWEAEIYGDIFQEDSETKSSSVKIMQLLKTARSACSSLPRFVLKTDDDVFVNTFSLVELLSSLDTYSSSGTMWCVEWDRKLDKPGNHSAWIVLRSNQSDDERTAHPPGYCIGAAYLMTGRALDAIIRRHEGQGEETMLPEEVYVTGGLTREAGVSLALLGERRESGRRTAEEGVVVASLGDHVEEETDRLWRLLVREKLSENRRTDVGL